MSVQQDVLQVLDDVLALNGRGAAMTADTELLGSLPELDSVSVMAVIAGLEESFGFTVTPDELDAAAFSTVGTLSEFVEAKIREQRPLNTAASSAAVVLFNSFSTAALLMGD